MVCYSCLLADEGKLLNEMKPLCLFRRALRRVWDEGYPGTKRFSENLGTMSSLISYLDYGWLTFESRH